MLNSIKKAAEQLIDVFDGSDLPDLAVGTKRSLHEFLSADELSLVVELAGSKDPSGHRSFIEDAEQVAESGVEAICVVTDDQVMGGSLGDLRSVRAKTELPLIARGIFVHPTQLRMAANCGADAILTPLEALSRDSDRHRELMFELMNESSIAGLEMIVSVGSVDDLAWAGKIGVDAVVIDNRSRTGSIDVDHTFSLLPEVPAGMLVISESIGQTDEVAKLRDAGVDALLLDEGHFEIGIEKSIEVFEKLAEEDS